MRCEHVINPIRKCIFNWIVVGQNETDFVVLDVPNSESHNVMKLHPALENILCYYEI